MITSCSSWYPRPNENVARFLDFPENQPLKDENGCCCVPENDQPILHIKLDKISEGKIFFTAVVCGTRIYEDSREIRAYRFKAFVCIEGVSSLEDLNKRITKLITSTLRMPAELRQLITSYICSSLEEELLYSLHNIIIRTAHLSIRMDFWTSSFWAKPIRIYGYDKFSLLHRHELFSALHPFKLVKEADRGVEGFRSSFFSVLVKALYREATHITRRYNTMLALAVIKLDGATAERENYLADLPPLIEYEATGIVTDIFFRDEMKKLAALIDNYREMMNVIGPNFWSDYEAFRAQRKPKKKTMCTLQ